MYRHILVPVENGPADDTILAHVQPLARLHGSRLTLLHVADGWAARNYHRLNLAESEEIRADRAYLARRVAALSAAGFEADSDLVMGEPSDQIVRYARSRSRSIDLVAMSTHGHRLLGDLFFGNTADKVRHRLDIPVLLLKARA